MAFLLVTSSSLAQVNKVSVLNNDEGMKLTVDGDNFIINGMNWDYFPIGSNYSYSLWDQSDTVIKTALDSEMSMLSKMGVNTIRQYSKIPPKCINYIYEEYGIYTMLNHSFGRYGLTLNGNWVGNTEYSDPLTQEVLLSEITQMVEDYKDTPGLLLYLLGNENNYGLFWGGSETEDIPVQDEESSIRAAAMYKLFNRAALAVKELDSAHPVAICNGDLLFLEIIKDECRDIDIFGINIYRGTSFGDTFERVKNELDKPLMLTEFGADAFDAKRIEEDQYGQAYYLVANWKEIYENASGLGKAGNSIGGFTFQFSDGWWKYGQTKNLDVHDNNASWSNGGYDRDFIEGKNNMNEEWFGICAKGPADAEGLYQLSPRAAYYALQKVHRLDPYASGTTIRTIEEYFSNIQLKEAVRKALHNK